MGELFDGGEKLEQKVSETATFALPKAHILQKQVKRDDFSKVI
jgi:hypothetical protein